MIKIFFSFLFVFQFSASILSQSLKDTLSHRDQALIEETKLGAKRRKDIVQNFKGLNYTGLINLIIRDINFNKLRSENLVFNYSTTCALIRGEDFGFVHYSKSICESDSENPAFNQANFWTSETISRIQKKHHKNLIPYLQWVGFVTDNTASNPFDKQIKNYYFDESKIIIDEVKKKSKGFYKEKHPDYNGFKFEKEIPIYYFSSKIDNKVLTLRTTEGKSNFDTLYLSFRNFQNKIVVVKLQYGLQNSTKDIYITYQFQKKRWKKITPEKAYQF